MSKSRRQTRRQARSLWPLMSFAAGWAKPAWTFGGLARPRRQSVQPLSLLVSLAVGGLHAPLLAQTVLTPDGRTATSLQRNGAVVDVRTGTIKGANAFNSFSRFEVGQGDTVNLRLPDGTSTLVNLVYDAPIRVDGVLNSVLNNKIGGRLVFADPFGMVVGRTGVLNVGSLVVTSPTRSAMLGVLGADGLVNDAALRQLIDGRLPQAASSVIRIDGRINALERVRLQAEQVAISAGASVTVGADAAHSLGFQSAVNTSGLEQATGIVERGGEIEIVGTALSVAGTLDASGRDGGGRIAVGRAGDLRADTVTVASSAVLRADATGNGDGGTIDVWGTSGNRFEGTLSARGGASGGNGGFAEVSAKSGLVYTGLADMRAPAGQTGRLLLDPDTICVAVSTLQSCSGGSITLFGTIQSNLATTHFDVVADTILYVGGADGSATSGTIAAGSNTLNLKAPDIRINKGSTLVTTGAALNLQTTVPSGKVVADGSVQFAENSRVATNGGKVSIKAADIQMASGATIDTTKSGGTSGDIAMTTFGISTTPGKEGTIQIDGGRLLADATGVGGVGGTISMAANEITIKGSATVSALGDKGTVQIAATATEEINIFGVKNAESFVTIDSATISAETVEIGTNTKIENKPYLTLNTTDGLAGPYWEQYDSNYSQKSLNTFTGLLSAELLGLVADLAGINVVIADSTTQSKVNITGNTVITGTKSTKVSAEATTEAGNADTFFTKFLGPVGQGKFGLGAMYVGAKADTKVSVGTGVTFKGGDLTISARNDSTAAGEVTTPNTDNSVQNNPGENAKIAAAFGVLYNRIDANVDIGSGVNLHSNGNYDISAVNRSTVQNRVDVSTGEAGNAALALAITVNNTNAKVNLRSSIPDALTVQLQSIDAVVDNSTFAEATAGATPFLRASKYAAALMSEEAAFTLYDAAKRRKENAKKEAQYTSVNTRIAGGVALDIANHTAQTELASGLQIHTRDNGGDSDNLVFIGSWTNDNGTTLKANAQAFTSTTSGSVTTGSGAKTAPAGALTIGITDYNANTIIGDNTVITGKRVGLMSNMNMDMRRLAEFELFSKETFSSFAKFAENFKLFSGTVNLSLLNNQVKAVGSGDEVGFAGSISVVDMDIRTRTELGTGVTIQQNNKLGKDSKGNDETSNWNVKTQVHDDTKNDLKDEYINWSMASPITAQSSSTSAFITQAGPIYSRSAGQTGVGISDAIHMLEARSDVIVREGVTIRSVTESSKANASTGLNDYTVTATGKADDVTLRAFNDNIVVGFAIGAGKSKDTAVVVMGIQNFMWNDATVRVDDEVSISSTKLSIDAADTPIAHALTGAFSLFAAQSVGVAISANYIETDTVAEIKDNDTLASGSDTTRASKVTGTSAIDVGTLSANAHTGGAQYAVGVAGGVSDVSNNQSALGKTISQLNAWSNNVVTTFNRWMGDSKVDQSTVPAKAPAPFKGTALAGAGSIALNITDLQTTVNLDGAKGKAGTLQATATGDAAIASATGAGTVTFSGQKSQASGETNISGAISLNVIGNKVTVNANKLDFTDAGSVSFEALKGGENLSLAVGLTISNAAQDKTSKNFAGVASLTFDMPDDWTSLTGPSRNAARVNIKDSKFTGTDTGDFSAVAYNSSLIGTGGGSATAGGKSSIGAAITYSDIFNDTSVTLDGVTTSKFKNETVLAHSAAQIVSAAASASVSKGMKDSFGFSGAVVGNYVANTTQATVKNSTLGSGGGLSVKATEGVRQSVYDNKIKSSTIVPVTDDQGNPNGYDYSGNKIFTDSSVSNSKEGSSILAIAGVLQASTGEGSSNAGASLTVNVVRNTTGVEIDTLSMANGAVRAQASSEAYIRALSIGASVSGEKSIGGSVTVNVIANKVESTVNKATTRGAQSTVIDGAYIDALAGQINVTTGQKATAAGGAFGVNIVSNDLMSRVSDSTITGGLASGGSNVVADTQSNGRIRTIVAAGAVSANSDPNALALSGSLGFNLIDIDQTASVTGTTLGSMTGGADVLRAQTSDASTIQVFGGALTISGGAAFGGALLANTIDNDNIATLDKVSASAIETTTAQSTANNAIDAIAIGVSASKDKLALAGSAAANTMTGSNAVTVSDSSISGTAATVKAEDTSTIQTLSGAISVSLGKSAVGAAGSINTITNDTTVNVSNSTLSSSGAGSISAREKATIKALAAGAAASKDVAVEGSLATNTITNTTTVAMSGGSVTANGLSTSASDESTIDTLAGAAAVSTSGTAVGAALAVNTIVNKATVSAARTTLSGGTGKLDMSAKNTAAINAIAVSAAISAGSGASVSAVGANNVIINTTTVDVLGGSASGTGISLAASDSSKIQGLNGSAAIGFGGGAAVGGALSNNNIINTVRARIDEHDNGSNKQSTTLSAGSGALEVQATNATDISTLAAAAAGTSGVAVSGSATNNVAANTTRATVAKASGSAASATIKASDTAKFKTLAGSAALSTGGTAVGVAAAVNTIVNTTEATTDSSTLTFTGAANVNATASETIQALAVAGAFSSDVAVAPSFTVNTVTNTTRAQVKGGTLSAGSATLSAADTSKIETLAGGAAVTPGTAAVGGAGSANTITNTTEAVIDSASIGTGSGALTQKSENTGTIRSLAAAGSASGTAAVAASAAANTITNSTRSKQDKATLTAGSLDASASDTSTIQTLSGSAALSLGAAGVGFAGSVNTIVNTVSTGGTGNSITVTNAAKSSALNKSKIDSIAVAMSAAGGASVSPSAAVNTITNTTRTSYTTSSVQAGSIALSGQDESTIRNLTGAAAIDFGGGAAVGGAGSVNTIVTTAEALVDGGTWKATGGAITLDAVNKSKIQAIAVSAAVSSNVGVAGSLSTDTITNTTRARMANATLGGATGGLRVKGDDTSTIETIAGAAAVGVGAAGVGAAITVNTIVNKVTGEGDKLSGSGSGTAEFASNSAATIKSIAAAAAGSSGAAVGGSSATNTITNTNNAILQNSALTFGDYKVAGSDTSGISTLSGSVALSGGVSVGAAIAVNTIANTNNARVVNSLLNGGLALSSTNSETIKAAAAAAAGSTSLSISGSVAVNTISNNTLAEVDASTVNGGTTQDVSVKASDTATIENLAGSVAIGGGTSVGAALASNVISNDVDARIRGGTVNSAAAEVDARTVTVDAASSGSISSIAVAGAADATAGVAGSVAVNVIANDTRSAIDRNANVDAENDVLVTSLSNNDIKAIGGALGVGIAAAGVGASLGVSVISGDTSATIGGNDVSGSKTTVNARGKGAGSSIITGELTSLPTMGFPAKKDLEKYAQDALTLGTQTINGVGVTAASRRRILEVAGTVGASSVAGVAVTLNANANLAKTSASILEADINQGTGASAAQDVAVVAANHSLVSTVVGNVAVGITGAGVGGALQGSGSSVNTTALVRGSSVKAADALSVTARATESANAMAVGLSGGFVGVQGSSTITVLTGTTEAAIYGGTLSAGSTNVRARHDARSTAFGGALAGGAVGAGFTVNVLVNNHTTTARVGGVATDSSQTATTDISGALSVTAESVTDTDQYTVVGAAGAVGLSAGVGVMVLGDTAQAYVNNATVKAAGKAVTVEADVRTEVDQVTGAAAVGGVSAGAALGVAVTRGVADAFIRNSTVAAGTLTLDALNQQDLDAGAISGAFGGTVGLAGTVQVSMIGYGAPGDSTSSITKSDGAFTQAASFGNKDRLGTDPSVDTRNTESGFTKSNQDAINNGSKYDFASALSAGSANTARARVIGSTITLDTKADINSATETALRNSAGGVGIGVGVAGLAAGVSIARVNNSVIASVDTASKLLSSDSKARAAINVGAQARDLSGSWALGALTDTRRSIVNRGMTGGASLGLGFATTVVDSEINNQVSTAVAPSEIQAGNVTLSAGDSTTIDGEGYGGSGGLVAVGVVSTTARRNGAVATQFEPTKSSGNVVNNLSLSATNTGRAEVETAAGSLGIGAALSGNVAIASDAQAVTAQVGAAARFNAEGTTSVTASRSSAVSSKVTGINASLGAAIGASYSEANYSGDIRAEVLGGDAYAGAVTVRATASKGSLANNVYASAAASGGGLLVGANGAWAKATDSSGVHARWANDQLSSGDMTIEASRNTYQYVDASAAAGGFIGLGKAYAQNISSGDTSARVEGITTSLTTRDTDLTLNADSLVSVLGTATAGSGGLIAGNASEVNNTVSGKTVAYLGTGTASAHIRADDINMRARRLATVNGGVNTVNASLLGKSGGDLRNTITQETAAEIGANADIRVDNITMLASGEVTKDWWSGGENGTPNIRSGSGGLLDLPAVTSRTTVKQSTTVNVADGARVMVDTSSNLGSDASRLRFDARSLITLRDRVVMNSGGAIPVADAVSDLDVQQDDNLVSFGSGTKILAPKGDILAGSRSQIAMDSRASVDTYGLAGAPEGTAYSTYVGSNKIALTGATVSTESGDIYLYAGMNSDGTLNQFNIASDVHTWNKTAIPIAGGPDAKSSLTSKNSLVVDAKSLIESASDVDLAALSGTDDINYVFGVNKASSVTSVGIGKDVYREAASAIVSGISNAFGGDDVSFDIKNSKVERNTTGRVEVQGVVRVGASRSVTLVIDPTITFVETKTFTLDDGSTATLNVYDVGSKITTNSANLIIGQTPQAVGQDTWARISWLRQKEADYAGTAEALGYANERQFLENRLVSQGLATRDASGNVQFGSGSSGGKSERQLMQTLYDNLVAQQTTFKTNLDAATTEKNTVTPIYNDLSDRVTQATKIKTEQANLVTLQNTATSTQNTLDAAKTTYDTWTTKCISGKTNTCSGADLTSYNNAVSAYNSAVTADNTADSAVTSKITEINGLVTTYDTLEDKNALKSYVTKLNLVDYKSTVTTTDISKVTADQTSYNTTYYQPALTQYTNTSTTYNNALSSITTIKTNLDNNKYSNVVITGPQVTAQVIPDIAIKLGDIRIRSNELVGTGSLSAPGDAQVRITNNSSNPIKVGNISVSSTGGEIRMNGFLVDNNSDINKINQIDASASGASFATVNTRRSGGATAEVVIKSTYNPDNETDISKRRPAPDITLMNGTTIFNPDGLVSISSEAGSIMSQGTIRGGVVDISAKNGDFVQSYINGFFHVGADPKTAYENASTSFTPLGIVANGGVLLNARYLNINGLVQSGITDWEVTLPSSTSGLRTTGSASFFGVNSANVLNFRASYLNKRGSGTVTNGDRYTTFTGANGLSVSYDADKDELSADYAAAATAINSTLNPSRIFRMLPSSASDNLGYSYDAANDRFIVDGTSVKAGYIKLFGQIMNTADKPDRNGNTLSQLKVGDGFGSIKVTNNSGKAVVVGNLDVGTGAVGLVEIGDIQSVNKATGTVSVKNTVITRDPTTGKILTTTWTDNGSKTTTESASASRSTSYAPQALLRYQYATGTDESTITEYQVVKRSFFGADSLTVSQWKDGADVIYGPFVQNKYDIPDGQRLLTGTDAFVLGDPYYAKTSVTQSNGAETVNILRTWSECDPWLCITSRKYTQFRITTPTKTITTHKIKADNPIAVTFGGSDAGTVSINSNASVLLQGAVRNISGTTTIDTSTLTGGSDAGNITQLNDLASITSKSVVLKAKGSVGSSTSDVRIFSAADPFRPANGTPTATLSGLANAGDFRVRHLNSDTVLGTVSASGTVSIWAKGSISRASANDYVQGSRIELNSANGAIGDITNSAPINLRALSTLDPAQFLSRGVLITAYGDINVNGQTLTGNTSGDLLVDTIASATGSVRVSAAGRIRDGNPDESIDTKTWNQLLAFWDATQLRGNSALEKQDIMVAAYQSGVNRDYQMYWETRQRQEAQTGTAAYDANYSYTLTTDERAAFAAAGLTTAQISAYEADKTTEYRAQHARLNTIDSTLTTSPYSASYSYTATQTGTAANGRKIYDNAEINNMLKGSSWTDKELGIALTPGLLKETTNTSVIIKDPNISGTTVELRSNQGAGAADAAPITVDLTLTPDKITDAQKIALVTAERSDLTLNSDGTVTIRQVRPINIAATNFGAQGLTADTNATGSIYASSRGNLALTTVRTDAEARIKVQGALTAGTPLGTAGANVIANLGVLEAADGGIGTALSPMQVLATGTSNSYIARAAKNIYLTAPSGDLNIDTVYSPSDVFLVSTAGKISAAFSTVDMDVRGKSIDLKASGNIGSSSSYLDVGADSGQLITAKSTAGGIYLRGASGSFFDFGAVDAVGDVILDGFTAPVNLTGRVSTTGNIAITSGSDVVFKGTSTVTSKAGSIIVDGEDIQIDAGARLSAAGNASFGGKTITNNGIVTAGRNGRMVATAGDLVFGANALFTGSGTFDGAGKSVLMDASSRLQFTQNLRLQANGYPGAGSGNATVSLVWGGNVELSTNNKVLGAGANNIHLRATGVGGQVRINTGNIGAGGITRGSGIGTQALPVRIMAPRGYATTDTGDVWLNLDLATAFSTVATESGAVTIVGKEGMSAQLVGATGNIALTGTNPLTAIAVQTATTSGGSLVASAPGELYFSYATAPQGISLTGTSKITLGNGTTNEDILAVATKDITAGTLQAGKSVSLSATSGAVTVGSAKALNGTLAVGTTEGLLTITDGQASGAVTISGASTIAGNLVSGKASDLTLQATAGDLSYGLLSAGRNVFMTARDNINQQSGSAVTAESAISVQGRTLAGGGFEAKGGGVTINALAGDAAATSIKGTTISVTSQGDALLGSLATTGGLAVTTAGSQQIDEITQAASATLGAGINATVLRGNVAGLLDVTAAGFASLSNLTTGSLVARGGSLLTLGGTNLSNLGMTLSASSGAITVSDATVSGGLFDAKSATGLNVTSASASSGITLDGQSLTLGTLSAGGTGADMILRTSAGTISYRDLSASRHLTATVKGAMTTPLTTGARLVAGGNFTFTGYGLRGQTLQAGGAVVINANSSEGAADVNLATVSGSSVAIDSSRNVVLGSLTSLVGATSVSALRDVTIQQLNAPTSFVLNAGRNATLGNTATCPTAPTLPWVYIGNGFTASVTNTLSIVGCASINGPRNITATLVSGL